VKVQEATLRETADSLAEFADAAFELIHNLSAQAKVLQAEIEALQLRVAQLEMDSPFGSEWT
jgi:hypothetical protein